MHKFLTFFIAVSLVFLICFSSTGAAQEAGVDTINLPALKEWLAGNEGKVVVVNFWSPF